MSTSTSVRLSKRLRSQSDIPVNYVRSAIDGRSKRELFAEVERYCMFIGYPRSGHSLVGSLLDAHPEAVIAHELDALRYVRAGFGRQQLFSMILRNDAEFTANGRKAKVDYVYEVPGQWQGRWRTLRVIGDKKGGNSTRRLDDRPQLLDQVRKVAGVPIRVVHVTRNPFDNIATMARRNRRDLDDATTAYEGLVATVGRVRAELEPAELVDLRHEDLLAAPRDFLERLCGHVDLEIDDGYVEACSGLLFERPNKSRTGGDWTPERRARVEALIDATPFLAGYAFDD